MKSPVSLPGRIASALAVLLAATPAVAEPFSSSGSFCAAFLAASNAATPEEALADAWAELILKSDRTELEEWALSELFSQGANPESSLKQALHPPSRLLDTAGRDGLSQLQELVELLHEQGTIDSAKLAATLADRAAAHAEERNRSRRAAEEGTQKRRTARDFVRVVRLSVQMESPILRLASGRLAVAGGHRLVFVDADGSHPVRVDSPSSTLHSVVQLADGRITVSSNEGWMQTFDEKGNPAGEIMLPGHRTAGLLALRDGGFVSANMWGAVTFVGPDHDFLPSNGDGAEGTVTGTPIQLSGNGNVVVTDHTGCVSFFSSVGELRSRTCTDFAIEGGALELANGDVLAVNGQGLGSVFDGDGTLRHQFSIEGAALTPVQFPGGTLAVPTSDGKIHFLDASGMPRGCHFDAGSAFESPLSIVRGGQLGFTTQDGNLHLVDEQGTEVFKVQRPDTIRAPLMDGENGTLIMGTVQGDLLFIDVDGLKTLGL